MQGAVYIYIYLRTSKPVVVKSNYLSINLENLNLLLLPVCRDLSAPEKFLPPCKH